MTPESTRIVDEYWAGDIGCGPDDLRPREPRVQVHAGGLLGYSGVFILTVDAAPVVSAPPELVDVIAPRAGAFIAEAVADPAVLRDLLRPAEVTDVIGPACLTYADRSSLADLELGNARELNAGDEVALAGLRSICPAEVDPKGFDLAAHRTFGAFGEDGDLVAVANFEIWSNRIAHLSVVSRPAARSKGHGTRAVAAAARSALDAGLVLQYRALQANHPSRRIASKLGFRPYGWSMAARLR